MNQPTATPPPVSFRPATEDDLEGVVAIEKQWNPTPWSKDGFAAELDKSVSHFLVLTDDETDEVVVGYVVFHVVDDYSQVLSVAVKPEFRKVGFGAKLIREAINESVRAGVSRMGLEVRKSNAAAFGLYQEIGFHVVRIVQSFYSDGEDAYSMEIAITDDGVRF
jgi:ribosomal-protein-alanine N-acetyltransferase